MGIKFCTDSIETSATNAFEDEPLGLKFRTKIALESAYFGLFDYAYAYIYPVYDEYKEKNE